MRTRRQPDERFLRRLEERRKPAVKPPSRIRRYKDSDAWLWTEVAAVFVGLAFVIPTAIALCIDLEDRQTQRIAQAWELVTRTAPGNSGKGPALEYLKSQEIALTGIDLSADSNRGSSYLFDVDLSEANLMMSADLSGANLYYANLSKANLHQTDLSGAHLVGADLSGVYLGIANLSGANLSNAYLSGAHLESANLSGADLMGADLSGAKLYLTDLSGAHLYGVNLSGADLEHADLSGAHLGNVDLSEFKELDPDQLDAACSNKETRLPNGLTIKPCPVGRDGGIAEAPGAKAD